MIPLAARLAIVRRFRHLLADEAETFAAAASGQLQTPVPEGLVGEVLPLADACRFLEREAETILAPRRLGSSGRPVWLFGVNLEIRREPIGIVLVIGPHNYPLLLAGVQAIQALVAGNTVLLKPGRGGKAAADALASGLARAGLPPGLLTILDEGVAAAREAIAAGVDKVLLTGSATTGRTIMAELAKRGTPSVMELSGCDACLVLPGADLDLVARALAFGLRFKGSATCIAPRRVFASPATLSLLEAKLTEAARAIPARRVDPATATLVRTLVDDAVASGARLAAGRADGGASLPVIVVANVRPGMPLVTEDVFAPVISLIPTDTQDGAVASANANPYALGASVFGPLDAARRVAGRLEVGCVVINDVIAPTGDPRLPFGGRRASGFGVTRGAEGLLELTTVKAVSIRNGRMLRHLDPPQAGDDALFLSYLRAAHAGTWRGRAAGLYALARALVRSERAQA